MGELVNAPKGPVYLDKGGWDDVMYHGGRFDPAYDSWTAGRQRSYEFGREFAATVRAQIGECPFPETYEDRRVMVATMVAATNAKILQIREARRMG